MSGTLSIGNETLFTHSDSTGMSYGSGIPAGTVIQVVSENFNVSAISSSSDPTNYTPTFLTKSITPKATNSKFLVMVTSMTGGDDASPRILLRRTVGSNTHDIANSNSQDPVTMSSDARLGGVRHGTNFHLSYVDSPAVSAGTSINYLIMLKSGDSTLVRLGQSGFTTVSDGDFRILSSMTIMEIAA